jgi:hypothetical protein
MDDNMNYRKHDKDEAPNNEETAGDDREEDYHCIGDED